MERQAQRHLVIVGSGHAHVHVLKSFAMRPLSGVELTVVSPFSYATYTGMVPGVLARQYQLSEAQIDARALAARAGAAFVADRVARIDAARRLLHLEERPPIAYDIVSIDIGSRPAAAERVSDNAPATMVKPIEMAVQEIEAALALPAPSTGRQAVVVGGGAGGIEIAFALAARLRAEGKGTVTVCDSTPRPVASRHHRTSSLVLSVLARHGITFLGGVEVESVDADGVRLRDGRHLAATLVVWATGASGPPLFAASGLPVDPHGFLRVSDELRCENHPEIFAAGDCATMASHPNLSKAGVYAVRQGPVLAHNLRAAARAVVRLRRYRPQKDFLSLLNTGDGKAILSRGALGWYGRSAWWLKDRIDRRFVRKYARPELRSTGMRKEMIPCGGCAAKLGADVLRRVLSRVQLPRAEGVVVGLEAADDAAVFAHPPGTLAVATVDAFPPFTDDLYVVGQVAATNAASDIYAMGAEATTALALVCLPTDDPHHEECGLEHFLRGALHQLERLGIALVGGHTITGEQALLGFAMHGWVHPDRVIRKAGARPGDALVLTKPLGTGVILAAARAGVAPAEWVEAALGSMVRSNGPAMRILLAHGMRACTDVTGFGLGGHLSEVLKASGVAARLRRDDIPSLPGARELLDARWRSSFHLQNVRSLGTRDPAVTDRDLALCADPQTSGGLLAAVPADQVTALQAALAAAGERCWLIGECMEGAPYWELV